MIIQIYIVRPKQIKSLIGLRVHRLLEDLIVVFSQDKAIKNMISIQNIIYHQITRKFNISIKADLKKNWMIKLKVNSLNKRVSQ